jgi:hypothetical protein
MGACDENDATAGGAAVTGDDWFAPDHVLPAQRLEPVTLGEPLWTLRKGDHTAEARVRAIDGIGLELRFEWNGDLRASQVFKGWDELDSNRRRGKSVPSSRRGVDVAGAPHSLSYVQ